MINYIYFDHCASTMIDAEILEKMQKIMCERYANPGSLHEQGTMNFRMLEHARQKLASLLQVLKEELTFTSGATESNNLAIQGVAHAYFMRGQHLIASEIEHPSVFETFKFLEKKGFEVTYLPVNSQGRVCMSHVEKALRKDTILVSVMHVNNEVGSIQPILEIGELLKKRPKTYFHVDAVQSLGKIPLNIKKMGVDLCSFSGHKLHGPKGIGLLYCKKGIQLQPLFFGGLQEKGLRPGTENLASVVGLTLAIEQVIATQKNNYLKLNELKKYLIQSLQKMGEFKIHSAINEYFSPHIVNISYPGKKAEAIVQWLSAQGIAISTQTACSSKFKKPSRTIYAMTKNSDFALSSLRISLDVSHTKEDLDFLITKIKEMIVEFERVKT